MTRRGLLAGQFHGGPAPDWINVPTPTDVAGAAESFVVTVTLAVADTAGASDQLASPAVTVPLADAGGAADVLASPTVTVPLADAGAAFDRPLTYSAGTIWSNSGTAITTLAVVPTAIGDAMIVGIGNQGTGVSASVLSGGGCSSWVRIAGPWTDTESTPTTLEFWLGTVTSTGSQTLTVTWSGSVSGKFCEITAQQFHASIAGLPWQSDSSAHRVNSSSSTVTFPLVSTSRAPEIYVGYAITPSGLSFSGGSPAGYTFSATNGNDGWIYSVTDGSSAATTPTGSLSFGSASYALGVTVYAGAALTTFPQAFDEEGGGAAEALTYTVALDPTPDQAAAAEALSAAPAVPLAEAAAAAESIAGTQAAVSLTDAAGAAEATQVALGYLDAAGAADAAAVTVSVSALPDAAAATDAPFTVAPAVPVADTAGGREAWAVTPIAVPLPESAGAAEALVVNVTGIAFPDRGAATDTGAFVVTSAPAQADVAGAREAFSAQVGQFITWAEAAGSIDALVVTVTLPLPERGAVADLFGLGQPVIFVDAGGSADAVAQGALATFPSHDAAGATESLAVAIEIDAAALDAAGAADGIAVVSLPVPAAPPGTAARLAVAMFVRSQMPRMHLQNLVTGQWLHRDVQGISNPSVTWVLGGPDTFTCTLGPPRPDLLDASGNPVAQEWRDVCYLEEAGEIKFGGILTSSSFSGPAWTPTFTGFTGYPSGIPYEGAVYKKTKIDALDVVRYLWDWLQDQPGGNIGMDVAATRCGVLLGSQLQSSQSRSTALAKSYPAGVTQIDVTDPTGFAVNAQISIAGGSWKTVTKISKNTFTLSTKTFNAHEAGDVVTQGGPGSDQPTPYELDWWNSTDIGQEIASIATEAVFDMREAHSWTSASKTGVRHQLLFGVPRIGTRKDGLRFAEGENITDSIGGQRDGSTFANQVIGLGAGQGSAQIRSQVANVDGHLRRVFTYTDQAVSTQARLASKARKILTSRLVTDTPASVVVRNHPNAPFGSFMCGDDIYVQWVTGWRKAGIWCRITQITQDPTTDQATLTLVRSESFTYLAQAGLEGTS